MWASPALPGAVHDAPAAREHGIIETLTKAVNRSHAKIRALGEQAMASLKTWRFLRELRCSTTRITDLVRAVLMLHLRRRGPRPDHPGCEAQTQSAAVPPRGDRRLSLGHRLDFQGVTASL